MKRKQTVIVCMVGLVGSGKSTVAKELAKRWKMVVVRGDDIRVELGKRGEPYDRVEAILLERVRQVVQKRSDVVIDSDAVQKDKRQLILRAAKKAGARLVFVRVTADMDVMLGRIMTATYQQEGLHPLFAKASSPWKGPSRAAVVKVRELWRRTPHHYRWTEVGGGKWALKQLPFTVMATIDTTDGKTWKKEVSKLLKRLR